jgi:uncharacterized membrane protein (GlpM family)
MTTHSLVIPIVQAVLCFAVVILLRLSIVYLGPRIGGLLIGTPMLIFPLMAMQAWLGPTPDQAQTIGSLASITSVTLGLWSMRLPFNFTALTAVLTMALAWLVILALLYVAKVPAIVMAATIFANAAFILIKYRRHAAGPGPGRSSLLDGAIPTVIFLLVFFLTTQVVPDFVRGVLAMFPVALLATLYFVRAASALDNFRKFVIYAHAAVTATATFVIASHFTIAHMPIALSLFVSLMISIMASVAISLIWRSAQVQAPAEV